MSIFIVLDGIPRLSLFLRPGKIIILRNSRLDLLVLRLFY